MHLAIRIFYWSILILVAALHANGQCGTLAISNVVATPVSCNGGSNGSITVNVTGGTSPFTYSNGVSTTGPAMVGLQGFDTDVIPNSGNSLTQHYSPSSCTGGRWFDYQASGGCTGGTAYYPGSTTTGFSGCYLRTPQRDASGLTAVTLKFDISHSYNVGRPNDKITFSIWLGNTYRNTTIVPVRVNGTTTNELTFNTARTCVPVEVVFNISNPTLTDKSDMLLYINSSCGYNTCSAYWVAIDNIEVLQGGGASSQSSNTFNNLPAGNYNISVQDANGCTLTFPNNPVVVTQPASALSANSGGTSPSTIGGNDGMAFMNVVGGTTPYTYLWNNGTTNDKLLNIPAGNYSVTVTDANGCTISANITVTNPPCALAITSVGKVNPTCTGLSNGSFTISATGGNGVVQYSINGGSTWQNNNSFTGLAAGNYTVQVRDAAGCTASASGNPQVIAAPQIMSLNFAVTPVSTVGGNNGTIDLTVTGGNTPRSFQWSNGVATEDLSNISPGQYCVTVTDAAGCTITGCGNVTAPVCTLAVTSVVANGPTCNSGSNGTITVTTTGANGAVQYSINGGNTWQATGSFTGLSSGSYTVQVRDAAGCTANAPANPYTINQPAAIGLNFVATPVSTAGGADGAINLTVTNGALPRTYQWSNGEATEDISNLSAGQYCITVTDNNGCSATGCQNVNQPGCSLAITSVNKTNALCFGGTGSIVVATSGGVGNVEYSINGGTTWAANGNFTNLTPGSYTVQVRDGNGCSVIANGNPYIISQPSAIVLSTLVTNASQAGATDGAINLTVSGGTAPYTVNWGTGAQTEDISNLGAGTYCVTVTDANACSVNTCATVTQPGNACAGFAITNVATSQPLCAGNAGSITISISGGQNPILYSIDSGATFQNGVSLFTVSGGNYNVLVRDINGCEVAYANNPVVINTPLVLNPVITANGPTLSVAHIGVNYQWLYGGNIIANANDTTYTVIANGSYSVAVTDANGCVFTSNPVAITGVSITEVAGLQWQLWPNPTENLLNYSITNGNNARLEIWGTDGRLVITQTIGQADGQVDLTNLAGGVYTVRLVTFEGQAIKRIVKY